MQKCTSGSQVNAWHPMEQSQNACGFNFTQNTHKIRTFLQQLEFQSHSHFACVLQNFILLYVKFYWVLSQNKEPPLPNCAYIRLTDTPSQPWQQLPQRKCQYATAINVWGNCAFFFFLQRAHRNTKHMAVKSTISLLSIIKTSPMALTVITLTACLLICKQQTNKKLYSTKTTTAREFYINFHFKGPLNFIFELQSP